MPDGTAKAEKTKPVERTKRGTLSRQSWLLIPSIYRSYDILCPF